MLGLGHTHRPVVGSVAHTGLAIADAEKVCARDRLRAKRIVPGCEYQDVP